MFIKLLLVSQLLLLSFSQLPAEPTDISVDEETLDDVHTELLETSTPALVTETEASATPADGLEAVDDALARNNIAKAEPESTTAASTTSTTTTTTTTTAATTTTEQSKKLTPEPATQQYPQPYPHMHHYPRGYGPPGYGFGSDGQYSPPSYPILRPYSPYGPHHFHQGFDYPQPAPQDAKSAAEKPNAEDKPEGQPKTAEEATLRPPYSPSPYGPHFSPYGPPPHFHRSNGYPSFGFPQPSPQAADKPKTADSMNSSEEPLKSAEEATPPFGYPPVYVVRRPYVSSYPYAGPARGYGAPFGYTRY
ncbi:CG16772 [Drosophila busckii]|uniref:CG16772 n=1 Tax=Drosophila busckii TaxID=30019 RepID=A0A0M4EC48_DROBS|nr:CG16772 [Drosophila busckii]